MFKGMKVFGMVVMVVLVMALAACKKDDNAGMPNPAAVYCEEQGGSYDIREGEDGQYGVCVFPDGSEVDGWDYYRGDAEPAQPAGEDDAPLGAVGLANPASVYCEEQGGRVDLREDEDGGSYGMCVFPDGTEIEEWEFFRSAADGE